MRMNACMFIDWSCDSPPTLCCCDKRNIFIMAGYSLPAIQKSWHVFYCVVQRARLNPWGEVSPLPLDLSRPWKGVWSPNGAQELQEWVAKKLRVRCFACGTPTHSHWWCNECCIVGVPCIVSYFLCGSNFVNKLTASFYPAKILFTSEYLEYVYYLSLQLQKYNHENYWLHSKFWMSQ